MVEECGEYFDCMIICMTRDIILDTFATCNAIILAAACHTLLRPGFDKISQLTFWFRAITIYFSSILDFIDHF